MPRPAKQLRLSLVSTHHLERIVPEPKESLYQASSPAHELEHEPRSVLLLTRKHKYHQTSIYQSNIEKIDQMFRICSHTPPPKPSIASEMRFHPQSLTLTEVVQQQQRPPRHHSTINYALATRLLSSTITPFSTTSTAEQTQHKGGSHLQHQPAKNRHG